MPLPVLAGQLLGGETSAGPALVVDDDRTTRMTLEALVRRQGYEVVSAADGRSAIARFSEALPVIVFLDVMLPDIKGYEVAREIKRLAGERFVPILFLTGLSERQTLTDSIEAGGDDFIAKPVDFATLRAKILAMERIRRLYDDMRNQREELIGLHERMQFEQSIAEQVFNDLVMARNVAAPPIRSWLKSASTFNGDLFLSCHVPGGGLAVMLGDFTGHGLAAAIGALPTSETFRTMTTKGFALIDVMAEINRKLNRLLPTGIFLAAAAIRIDPDLKTVLAWNSGMPEMILCRGNGERRSIGSHHPPLGVLPEFMSGTQTERIVLLPDDVFVMCSDGLTEACNEQGEAFGEERFLSLLDGCAGGCTFEGLKQTVTDFIGVAEQRDDISVVVVPCSEAVLEAAAQERSIASVPNSPDPWQWSLRLDGANLSRVDPVPLVMHHLKTFGVPPRHLQQIYVVVIELFNNALDHGVLSLDSALKNDAEGFMTYYAQRQQKLAGLREGYIEIAFDYALREGESVLSIVMVDSGSGFCHGQCNNCNVATELREENSQISRLVRAPLEAASGRGIRLISSLCRSVRYCGPGNRVEVEYLL